MKITISFNHNALDYKFSFDSDDIDMEHYETMWDYWFSAKECEVNGDDFDEDEVFELCADKFYDLLTNECHITSDSASIVVYHNEDEYDWYTQIEDVEFQVG